MVTARTYGPVRVRPRLRMHHGGVSKHKLVTRREPLLTKQRFQLVHQTLKILQRRIDRLGTRHVDTRAAQ